MTSQLLVKLSGAYGEKTILPQPSFPPTRNAGLRSIQGIAGIENVA
jgi:hypothetical protein